MFIQIAIVRLTTHNHQEEQDLDEAEVICNVNITLLSTVYTAASFSAKMYRFEKVFLFRILSCGPYVRKRLYMYLYVHYTLLDGVGLRMPGH